MVFQKLPLLVSVFTIKPSEENFGENYQVFLKSEKINKAKNSVFKVFVLRKMIIFQGSLLNGALCVLYVLGVPTYSACWSALRTCVLGILKNIGMLGLLNKMMCLACFKKLAYLPCFIK